MYLIGELAEKMWGQQRNYYDSILAFRRGFTQLRYGIKVFKSME
jgi:hypothetical protein